MSLAASKPVPSINTAAVSAKNGNESKYAKWSGLGMHIYPSWESYVDIMLAYGFTDLAMGYADYENMAYLATSKASVINIIAKGARVTWGITAGNINTITAANWNAYRLAILDGAQWAEDNGVCEFSIGNECEHYNDDTTLTDAQLRTNLKSVATEVQAIFTNGNISYSCSNQTTMINAWIAAGRGDIDILAFNIYKGGASDPDYDLSYQDRIDSIITAFGSEHTYISEFNVSYTSLEHYSADESVQAAALTEMIDYIKASGITRAIWFMWKDDATAYFGVMKDDGTYRLLWNQALLNTDSIKFATVPTKTTAASLPNTIALIPRITK